MHVWENHTLKIAEFKEKEQLNQKFASVIFNLQHTTSEVSAENLVSVLCASVSLCV